KADVQNGTAKVDRLDVTTADASISLRGIVPLPGRGLALSGRLDRTGASAAPIAFFVGGSWDAPYISPIMPSFERSPSSRIAACSSLRRWTSRRLLLSEAMMTPVATIPIRIVDTAVISGVTPRRP